MKLRMWIDKKSCCHKIQKTWFEWRIIVQRSFCWCWKWNIHHGKWRNEIRCHFSPEFNRSHEIFRLRMFSHRFKYSEKLTTINADRTFKNTSAVYKFWHEFPWVVAKMNVQYFDVFVQGHVMFQASKKIIFMQILTRGGPL